MINLAYAEAIISYILYLALFAFACVKWNDIKQVFSEGGKGLSSKRVIAIMGMVTFCKLAIYVTENGKRADPTIVWALVIIVLTASAIATSPQILDGISRIKGLLPSKSESTTVVEKEKQTEVTSQTTNS